MRPIKFRAWNIVSRKMIDLKKITPLALNMDTDGLFIPFSDGLPLMQFTGLLDENGIEIYEGDIVSAAIYFDEKSQILEVKFREASFVIDYIDSESDCVSIGSFAGDLQVIGNIYEHPELTQSPPVTQKGETR